MKSFVDTLIIGGSTILILANLVLLSIVWRGRNSVKPSKWVLLFKRFNKLNPPPGREKCYKRFKEIMSFVVHPDEPRILGHLRLGAKMSLCFDAMVEEGYLLSEADRRWIRQKYNDEVFETQVVDM